MSQWTKTSGDCARDRAASGAKNALMVSSVASMLDNFNRSNIDILLSMGYKVTLAANFDTEEDINSKEEIDSFAREMREKRCRIVQIGFTRKTSRIGQHCKAYRRLRWLAGKGFDLVHCHSPICAALTRLAFRKERKKGTRVIYTAHGFHFFKGAPLKNWLLYFPVEWLCARWTDVLITINREDYKRARRFMHAKKVVYVPGVGIDTKKFAGSEAGRDEKRRQLGVAEDEVMLLSVGELSVRKNVSIVIRAIGRLGDKRIKYFICGVGPLEDELKRLIGECGLAGRAFLLGYRSDISELCHAADLFVFPSLQEGLPVALMEAVASRTPAICSRVRGNTDLIAEERDLFDPEDVDSVASCICDAMGRDMDQDVAANYERLKRYDMEVVAEKMREEYADAASGMGGVIRLLERKRLLHEVGIDSLDSVILLSVGELNQNKNHEVAIRALSQLEMPNLYYLIAGQGSLEEYLIELAEGLNVAGQVHLLGYQRDMARVYNAADIFLFPSIREGLSVSLMEAMASGLPVVCSRIRGNVDLVDEGEGGYMCNARSVGEFSAAIARLANDPCLRNLMGRHNRQRIQKFDAEGVSKMMEEIYSLAR